MVMLTAGPAASVACWIESGTGATAGCEGRIGGCEAVVVPPDPPTGCPATAGDPAPDFPPEPGASSAEASEAITTTSAARLTASH